jgi:acetyl-CoA acetyltransferase
VAVVQREWAAKNPRATFKDPITVDDVMNSRMIAWPFRILMCCLVTDGGGALILTSGRPRQGLPDQARLRAGHGRERGDAAGQPDVRLDHSTAFRISGKKAFEEAGIKHSDVDHLMIYDAFAHLPLYGLEDLGFVQARRGGGVHQERNTRSGGKLPLNTNGGGLSYMHSGMYGMYALQESVRQMRGNGAGAGAGRQDQRQPGRRRHVRRRGHGDLLQRGAVGG